MAHVSVRLPLGTAVAPAERGSVSTPWEGHMVARNRIDPIVVAALAPHYRILDVLEPSGLGNVFLAEDARAGDRKVALKVFHRPLSDDPEFASRLLERTAASQ